MFGKPKPRNEVEKVWTEARVLSRLLDRLTLSDLTSKEAVDYLQRKGCPEDLAARAIAYCQERGFLDDQRFASGLVEKAQRTGWSLRKLRQVEAQKGLPASQDLDEGQACLELAQRWLLRGVVPEKVGARLQRRGFNYSLVKSTLNQLQEEL